MAFLHRGSEKTHCESKFGVDIHRCACKNYVPVLLEQSLAFVELNYQTQVLYRVPGKAAAVDKLRQFVLFMVQ